jgi:hypothetical protein
MTSRPRRHIRALIKLERAMGIEPTAQAWEAWVLPLYDARAGFDSSRLSAKQATRAID